MAIGGIIVVLLIVGFLIYMLTTVPIPINPWIKNLIVGIIFICLVIWLLNLAGIATGIHLRLR
jgi:succinate dehydrogenase hydrophobic anchor subunit